MMRLIQTLTDRATLAGIFGSIGSLTLSHWSSIAAIACSLVTAGYVVYRWQRDVRGRTCDIRDCPRRQREV